MRTVATVPETDHQDAGDARDQLRRSGTLRLFRGAAVRLRAAHGTTYARALGHSSLLTLIPAVIAVIGLVAVFDLDGFARVLEDAAASFAPGPAGSILTQALGAAAPTAGPSAVLVGLAGMLFSGTVGMTHLERAADRIYGVEEDRSLSERLRLAFTLAGTFVTVHMLTHAGSGVWSFVRWPVGVGLVAIAMTVIFRLVPNRHQPGFSWLLSGTTVSVTAWVAATILLGLVYEHASLLGDAFGPLIGVGALLVWAYATGLAVLFGLAFAAQLEAERAGERTQARDEPSR